jgi:hypothetical protein
MRLGKTDETLGAKACNIRAQLLQHMQHQNPLLHHPYDAAVLQQNPLLQHQYRFKYPVQQFLLYIHTLKF